MAALPQTVSGLTCGQGRGAQFSAVFNWGPASPGKQASPSQLSVLLQTQPHMTRLSMGFEEMKGRGNPCAAATQPRASVCKQAYKFAPLPDR